MEGGSETAVSLRGNNIYSGWNLKDLRNKEASVLRTLSLVPFMTLVYKFTSIIRKTL